MSTPTEARSGAQEQVYNKPKLFWLSVLALVTAGLAGSIRADIIPALKNQFFMSSSPEQAATMIGAVAGAAFLGFAISVFVGSPLCDYLGMGRLLGLASLLFLVGGISTIMTAQISGGSESTAYWVLWGGWFTVGLAHGLVEAVINPLIATIYADDKTHRLNVLHAYWPGGLMAGGLIGFALGETDWRIKMIFILVPAVIFGLMLIGTKFPPTERVASGVSSGEMIRQVFNPFFLLWFFCMFLTAASELAPGQWVNEMLSKNLGFPGILVLVYISLLMFGMRFFAGPLAHRFSPVGLLWISCLLASLGLVALSYANNPVLGILAATLWGTGVCYMWPTMLGVTSERFPKGGALLLGMMGSAGNLSIYFVLPAMGRIYDHYSELGAQRIAHMGMKQLQKAVEAKAPQADVWMAEVLKYSAPMAFRWVALLPAFLLIVFGAVWLWDKAHGGYKAVRLSQE